LALPFADATFDFCFSLGVFEHIGRSVTDTGITTAETRIRRRQFAHELLRVLKPGGHALVTSPNRRFPIDFWHVPQGQRLRLHVPWEEGLPSFAVIEDAFRTAGRASFRHLPQAGYHTFTLAKANGYPSFAMSLFRRYIELAAHSSLLSAWTLPMLVVLISKQA
jgi:SAM-dependent methyltransferase